MTIRCNVLVGCESGVVKGIDTVNNGIYVIHKPTETYADMVNCLEWTVKDQHADYMQVRSQANRDDRSQDHFYLVRFCHQTESSIPFQFCR